MKLCVSTFPNPSLPPPVNTLNPGFDIYCFHAFLSICAISMCIPKHSIYTRYVFRVFLAWYESYHIYHCAAFSVLCLGHSSIVEMCRCLRISLCIIFYFMNMAWLIIYLPMLVDVTISDTVSILGTLGGVSIGHPFVLYQMLSDFCQ